MVELMIVVAIISLMTTTVSLTIEAMLPGERLNTTIRILSSDLRSIRTEAISKGLEFRLIYDLENDRYRWSTPYSMVDGGVLRQDEGEDYDSVDRRYTSWVNLAEGVEFKTVYIAGLPFSQGEVFVRFDPLGTATDHTIVVEQPEYNATFTLEVLPLTGLVRMHDDEYHRPEPTDSDFN